MKVSNLPPPRNAYAPASPPTFMYASYQETLKQDSVEREKEREDEDDYHHNNNNGSSSNSSSNSSNSSDSSDSSSSSSSNNNNNISVCYLSFALLLLST